VTTSYRPERIRLHDRTIERVSLGQGEPLIVLEAGMGNDWSTWIPVLPQLAERSRVMAYSRPGYGGSSAVGAPRDISTEARELHQMLRELGEKPPYVLVGHSLGGLITQACAADHQQDIAGLVLVDAPHPDQIEHLNRDASQAGEAYRQHAASLTGAPRQEHEALTAPRGGHFAGEAHPYAGPMVILSAWLRAGPASDEYRRYRHSCALQVAARYPQAELRKIHCYHYIHRERTLAVIDAVDEVLARAKYRDSGDARE
jgi:pimeloyl-ACP methyl ester carboxylesterase